MTRGSMNFCLFAYLLALFKWGGGEGEDAVRGTRPASAW